MLKGIETENVIKNIIREITRVCAYSKNINVGEDSAANMIKLMVLNPDYGFTSDRPLSRDDVEYLVQLCVNKLSEKESPSLATMHMQVFFDTNYATKEEIIAENRTNVKSRTAQLVKEIIESTATNKDDVEKVYRKIVMVTVLGSGLGNPMLSSVLKEAQGALHSVFPISELSKFMSLSRRDKEQQISELTSVVSGIRLFNRDCKLGGEGIDDLPTILQQSVQAAISTLQGIVHKLLEQVDILTTAVDSSWRSIMENAAKAALEGDEAEEDTPELTAEEQEEQQTRQMMLQELELVKDSLVVVRQQEVYFRRLLVDAEAADEDLKRHLEQLNHRLRTLHETVRFRTAVPAGQVFPQFVELSAVWTRLQDQIVLLSTIGNLSRKLQSYSEVLGVIDEDLLKNMIGDARVLTDAGRLEATMGLTIDGTDLECQVIDPATVIDFDHIPLQLLGFCPWAFVEGKGALIPGNPNMGVLSWERDFYACSSLEAANKFGREPQRYVAEALDLVRRKPEFVGLLQLQDQIAAKKSLSEMSVKGPELVVKRDSEMQTEIHPVPANIDHDYQWNEWELKRLAIQLANICNSRTHSTQTNYTHFRSSIASQAVPPRAASTQTMQDGWSNVPRLQNFIFGLRGRKDDVQHVVTLTRPVHE